VQKISAEMDKAATKSDLQELRVTVQELKAKVEAFGEPKDPEE